MTDTPTPKARRGFAAMDPAKQREIASRGGKRAHETGAGRQFTVDEARHAGQRGGASVSRNRAHMAEIGARGGRNRHKHESA